MLKAIDCFAKFIHNSRLHGIVAVWQYWPAVAIDMVDDSFGCGKSWHPRDDGKNLFIYWDKGVGANTPEVVHEALRAWRVFAQCWQICFIDGRRAGRYASTMFRRFSVTLLSF